MKIPSSFGNHVATQIFHSCGSMHRPTTSMSYATWVPRLFKSDTQYAYYWRDRKSCVNNILEKYKIKHNNSHNLTLHFRCGDVPFSKHRIYRMPSYAFLNSLTTHLKNNNIVQGTIYSKFNIKNSSKHYSVCMDMVTNIKNYFEKKNMNINFVKESSTLKTLQRFAQSRFLVSLVPSSFSFVVGVSGQHFITPFLGLSGVEGDKTLDNINHTRAKMLAKKLHWTMITEESLPPGKILTRNDINNI